MINLRKGYHGDMPGTDQMRCGGAAVGRFLVHGPEAGLKDQSVPEADSRGCRVNGLPHSMLLAMMVVLFLTAICPVPSSAQSDRVDALIDKALKLSGVTGQLDRLGETILSAIPGDAFSDAKMKNEVTAFLKKEAAREKLLPVVRAALKEDLDEKSLEKVVGFYDSKVGRKIGHLQEASLDPGVLKGIREGRKITSSLDEPRLNLLRRIMKADRVSEVSGAYLTSVIRGLIDGSRAPGPEPSVSTKEVQEKMHIMENAIRSAQNRTEDVALVAFAYTFRSVDDKELQELALYRESPQAAWFRNSSQKGFDRAVYNTARSLGEAVTRWRSLPPQVGPGSPTSDREPQFRDDHHG
jgi:hypothetical protein